MFFVCLFFNDFTLHYILLFLIPYILIFISFSTPMKMFINGQNHIAGRLASKVAKALLEKHEVTVFFTESISYAFGIERARKIYESYLHKRCVVNPNKGPYHYVEPSKYFKRMVKRMLRHKTKKGALALARLTVHESIPREHYDTELMLCPEATLKIKSNPIRKSTKFGDFLKDFGWKHSAAVAVENDKYQEYVKMKNEEEEMKKNKVEMARKDKTFQKRVDEILNSYE